jgi:hypothetical protein
MARFSLLYVSQTAIGDAKETDITERCGAVPKPSAETSSAVRPSGRRDSAECETMFFLPAVRQSRWRIIEILDSLFFSGSQLRQGGEPASCEILLLKETGMPGDKGMQLSRDAIEMIGHFVPCLIRLARRNRPIDRFVLHESSLRAPRLGKKRSAHSFKMGSDRVKYFANPCETEALGHLAMEPGVEFVEALKVSACDGRLLIGKILAEAFDCAVRHICRTNRDNLDLERAAHQHPLPHILKTYLGDVRAALRLDHDESFECEPIDRSRYR